MTERVKFGDFKKKERISFILRFLAHLVERWTQKVLQSAIASSSRSYRQLI